MSAAIDHATLGTREATTNKPATMADTSTMEPASMATSMADSNGTKPASTATMVDTNTAANSSEKLVAGANRSQKCKHSPRAGEDPNGAWECVGSMGMQNV
ncbi:hypothetical protein BDN71DRAFT_1510280 [Pleurotus eryngii]|uniref:Uncharacterized protein n=1 Tax=Pleurotus eryngii TaxID=5323 RepID=A0A9P6D556_PLEER|nr:hypothetical protein BDN71DRAFT_1510280 [Pleurotus eryngii]